MSNFSSFMNINYDDMSMIVESMHLNDHGTMHGGLLYAFCMEAVVFYVERLNRKGAAMEGNIHYYRPAFLNDCLKAVIHERKNGKKMSVYLVELINQESKLIADCLVSVMWNL